MQYAHECTTLIRLTGSALANWTSGNWANGTKNPDGAPSLVRASSTPAWFVQLLTVDQIGANFQAITWAQSEGGYLNANGSMPNRTLENALNFTDQRLGAFIEHLETIGTLGSTLLLLGSKQGQGPINPKTLVEFDQSVVVSGAGVPVAFFTGDDGGIVSPSYLALSRRALTGQQILTLRRCG